MRRSRILVAIKGLGIGGAEKLVVEGARHWDRERFDYLVVYALPWKDALVADLESLGVPVECVGSKRGLTPGAWARLRRVVRAARIDLVHAHLPAMGATARLFAGVPVVYTEHNLAQSYRLPVRLVNRITYRRNRASLAVSKAVADSVAGYGGPPVDVIVNGVSPNVGDDDAAAARRELAIAPDQPLVVHVGNIRPGKGHDNLVAATELLAERSPRVRVVSIGGEKWPGDLDRLRRLAEESGVSDRIVFLGSRPDALRFAAAADVFVNPSDVEGLPVAVLEAMALGRPVVATSVGGVPGLVRDGDTGVLVPPGRPDALAAAIDGVLDDHDRAEALGKAGAELVEREYGLSAMVRAVEDVYRRILDG